MLINPIAFSLAGVPVAWYGILAAVSACVVYFNPRWGARNDLAIFDWHLDPPTLWAGLLTCGIFSAHATYLWQTGDVTSATFLSRTGVSVFGLIAGATLYLAAFCCLTRSSFITISDRFLYNAPIAFAAIRLGNFVNGEGWGGVVFLRSTVPFPSQILEGAACLLILAPLLRRAALAVDYRPGMITARFLIGYGSIRLIVESTRSTHLQSAADGFQALAVGGSVAFIVLGITMAVLLQRNVYKIAVQPLKALTCRRSQLFVPTAAASAGLAIIGCGKPPSTYSPGEPASNVYLNYSNPTPASGSDPNCSYPSSRAAYLFNGGKVDKSVAWTVTKTDSQGKVYPPQKGQSVVPPSRTGTNGTYIGCTIDSNGSFFNRYDVIGYSLRLSLPAAMQKALGQASFVDARVCNAVCSVAPSAGGSSCLQLGSRYYSAIAPIGQIVEKARNAGRDVPKADLLDAAKLTEADDVCHRGDIVIGKDGLVTNKGETSTCSFSSSDLPPSQLAALGITSTRRNPTRMFGVLRQTFEMKIGASRTGVIGQSVDDQTAPFVIFNGAGGDKLTANYGGPVHEVSRISVAGRPPQTVIATSNGCIAVAEQ